MVKSKNIIAGLGVVAGLGVALLPLGAFAATEDTDAGHYIRAKVGETIELTFTDATDYTQYAGYNDHMPTAVAGTTYSLAAVEPGQLNSKITHNLRVDTNARGGFELKMSTTGGNALRLITAYDGNTKRAAENGYSDSVKIDSVADGDTLDNDSYGWGFKVKASTAQNYSGNYKAIPGNDYVTIVDSKRDGSEGKEYHTNTYDETYNVNFGIRPVTTQASGNYEAIVNYKAVANVLGEA